MSSFTFKKAERSQQKLRVALDGSSGAGKTFSAIRLGFALIDAGLAKKLAVIDTENGSASLYADEAPDGRPWVFDTLPLNQFNPDQYVAGIAAAEKAGYDVIVIDSLSHAWQGKGGVLDIVDQKGGKFTAWKDATPIHRKLIDAIIQAKAHVIATMRSKTEYVLEPNDKGKMEPRKVGVAPVQREGMEYEFDVYGSVDGSHQIKISKSRCPALQDATGMKPGPAFWQPLFDWLTSAKPGRPAAAGEPEKATTAAATETATTTKPAESAPSANGKPTRLSLSNLISDAVTAEQLTAAGSAIKAAKDAGHIDDADVAALTPRFQNRKAQITTTPTAAAGGAAAGGPKTGIAGSAAA